MYNLIQWRKYRYLIYIVVMVVAIFLQWYTHGVELFLTDDSYHYLAARDSFVETGQFMDDNGRYFLFWPPLFPIVLSLLANPMAGASLLFMALTVGIGILLFLIVDTVFNSRLIALICFAYIMLDVHLLCNSSFLWSEIGFTFLLMGFIYCLMYYGKSLTWEVLISLSGFLMCMQRNAGAFIIAGAFIWMVYRDMTNKRPIIKSIWVSAMALSGLVLWNVYVWIFRSHTHFNFEDQWFQFAFENTTSLAQALVRLFVPIPYASVILVLLMAVVVAGIIFKMRSVSHAVWMLMAICCSYLLCVWLVLLVNIAGFPVDFGEADRFISVIAPVLIIIVFQAMECISMLMKDRFRKLFVAVLIFWVMYPLARSVKFAMQWHGRDDLKRTALTIDVASNDALGS